jgi:hypothetical protein
MLSVITQFILKNISSSFFLIFSIGLFSAAVQTIYFREYLSVFSGNELTIGMIFSFWMIFTGIGSIVGSIHTRKSIIKTSNSTFACILLISFTIGIFVLRAMRLIFIAGKTLGPLEIALIIISSQMPFCFINGYIIGVLLSKSKKSSILYALESGGSLLGSIFVFFAILSFIKNSVISILCSIILGMICVKNIKTFLLYIISAAFLFIFDNNSLQWKYNFPIKKIFYGYEGEIAIHIEKNDTVFFVNGSVYKSSMYTAFCEQAVHIPMSQQLNSKKVLVITDKGHSKELLKYKNISIDKIESEPLFASSGSKVISLETYKAPYLYDIIFIGNSIPYNVSTNRVFTTTFFNHIKTLLSDSGIVTFTLSFSENYLSLSEKKLYDAILNSLKATFKYVIVFPGIGYTFIASNKHLNDTFSINVPTTYLTSTIIPSLSQERFNLANTVNFSQYINTIYKPITLILSLEKWLELFKTQTFFLVVVFLLLLIFIFVFTPKNISCLSVATTGFAVGIYSICLLLIYQAYYGVLYSKISILLFFLTLGFCIGALLKKFYFSDLIIGFYCLLTLLFLTYLSYPSTFIFYLFHLGIGSLGGAQIVTRKKEIMGNLYAADLFGGALGMAIGSTFFIPLFGIRNTAIGIFFLKLLIEFFGFLLSKKI